MPSLTLTFTAPLNVSCQVGDTAYFVETSSSGGFQTNAENNIVEIGQIMQITNAQSNSPTIICETSLGGDIDSQTRFIMFSKDNKANLSSVLGYFASTKLVNETIIGRSELYSVSVDTFESSGHASK